MSFWKLFFRSSELHIFQINFVLIKFLRIIRNEFEGINSSFLCHNPLKLVNCMNTDEKDATKIQKQITLTETDPLSDWNVSCQILLIQRIHGQKRNFHFYGNHPGSLLLTFNFKLQKVFQLISSWHCGNCT